MAIAKTRSLPSHATAVGFNVGVPLPTWALLTQPHVTAVGYIAVIDLDMLLETDFAFRKRKHVPH